MTKLEGYTLLLLFKAGADYEPSRGILSFDRNNLIRTVVINISDDSALEFNEAFVIELDSNMTGVVINPSSATITIVDDDGEY